MAELDFVTDQELFDELAKRYDTVILIGSKDKTKEDTEYFFRWDGSEICLKGLMQVFKEELDEYFFIHKDFHGEDNDQD